jgi:hypothetical protein
MFARRTDMVVGVFVKTIEPQDSFFLVVGAGDREIESQSFITAAAFAVIDGHASPPARE